MVCPSPHGYTAHKHEDTELSTGQGFHEQLVFSSGPSYQHLCGLVIELRRVSGRHCMLLSLWVHCCTDDGLSNFYGVTFSLDVLQE